MPPQSIGEPWPPPRWTGGLETSIAATFPGFRPSPERRTGNLHNPDLFRQTCL